MKNESDDALGIILSLGLVIGFVFIASWVKELVNKYGLPSWNTVGQIVFVIVFISLAISTVAFYVSSRMERSDRIKAENERDYWMQEHDAVFGELQKWKNHPKLRMSEQLMSALEDRLLAWKTILKDVPVEELVQEIKERMLEEIDASHHR